MKYEEICNNYGIVKNLKKAQLPPKLPDHILRRQIGNQNTKINKKCRHYTDEVYSSFKLTQGNKKKDYYELHADKITSELIKKLKLEKEKMEKYNNHYSEKISKRIIPLAT